MAVRVHAEHETRVPPLELDRLAGRAGSLQLLGAEAGEHPADRCVSIALRVGVDRARDDQAVDRPRHRHVVEAQPLGPIFALLRCAHLVVAEDAGSLSRRRIDDAKTEATIGADEDFVGRRSSPRVTPRVCHDNDLELEPLRRVDREQTNGARSLLLRHRLELRGAHGLLIADERDEALDVAAAQLLVAPRQPHQLAEVRVPPLAVPPREDCEVVVVRRHDLLTQALEPEPRGSGDQPLVALLEGTQEPLVLLCEPLGQRALDAGVERPPAGVAANRHQRVVRDADERRAQNRRQRPVVVPVPQQAQVREQVDDLLLTEVPAARRPVCRQPLRAQRALVDLGIGAGCEEQDDLAGLGRAEVDELGDAPCDRARPLLRATITPASR